MSVADDVKVIIRKCVEETYYHIPKDNVDLNELGDFDSLDKIDLLLHVEKNLDIQINDDALNGAWKSIDDLTRLVLPYMKRKRRQHA